MNKQRRNRLGKAFDLITEAEQILEEVKREEDEAITIRMENLFCDAIHFCQDAESVIEEIRHE